MATTGIEIKGYNRVANKLRKTASMMDRELDPIVRQHARDTRRELKATPYPPRRPQQTYVRTGNLANRFGVRRMGNAQYSIDNTAEYATYVIGNARGTGQAWMHRGRWWKMRTIVQANIPELTVALTRRIEAIWR